MSRRTILVTGGAGFIGSNIVADLIEQEDARVVVCDRLGPAADGKWRNLAKHPIADFWAPEDLLARLAETPKLDAVIHMGAISATTEPDADLILQTNFVLSRRLWDWCRETGTPFIYASSAATFGAGEAGFRDTSDLDYLKSLRPLNAYGWSKALFDVWAVGEAREGRAPPQWAGLKFFNVYGPNEYHKGGMRSVVAQMWPRVQSGETVRLFRSHNPDYVDGGQMRDFVHVRDAAGAAVWLSRHPEVSGIFNVGAGTARSFLDLATAVFQAAGREPDIAYIDTPEDIRGQYQYFTEAEMTGLAAAGFTQRTPLEAGIADYVAGYLATPDPYR